MTKTIWTPENIEGNPSFSDDIRLYSHSGLCNRLRLIVAYKHFSDIKNKNIEFFWSKSPQCNGLFKDLFQPIPNINFTYVKWGARPKQTATSLDLYPHDEKIKNKNHLIFKPVDFTDFIESYPDKKVFLATDNRTTQEKFIKIFPKRLTYACVIQGDGSKRHPKRTTSIQDAVKDLFLCIGSTHFMGTVSSSYSTFIENYKKGQHE